jgi:hypothetical protein
MRLYLAKPREKQRERERDGSLKAAHAGRRGSGAGAELFRERPVGGGGLEVLQLEPLEAARALAGLLYRG